jgi:hypothetical protein
MIGGAKLDWKLHERGSLGRVTLGRVMEEGTRVSAVACASKMLSRAYGRHAILHSKVTIMTLCEK